MSIIIPPLKSQGIKTKLVPLINDIIMRSGVDLSGRWIEPFFGTGVVGFNSPMSGEHIVGDTNPHIIRFYEAIRDGEITAFSIRQYLEEQNTLLLRAEDGGSAHYLFVRNRFNESHSPMDFLFLSRAGFNGMMRFNRNGEWNIPFCKKNERFAPAYITKICNQVEKVRRIMKAHDWMFFNAPFYETIEYAGEDDFIYCDPPYYGRHADYYNGWSESDEKKLFLVLSRTKARFILSTWHHNEFRKNEMIDRLWDGFHVETATHFYHNGANLENRHEMTEALIFNFDLQEAAFQIEQCTQRQLALQF